MRQTTQGLDTGVASPDTQLSDKPSGLKAQNTESVAQPPLPPDRLSPFCRTIFKLGSREFSSDSRNRDLSVRTEMALHVLAYNMKRVTRILGVGGLIDAIRA
jgi:hypothetical protein